VPVARPALLVSLIAAAAVLLPSAAQAQQRPMVIQVISIAESLKAHDVPPKGPSAGDWVAMTDRLANAVARFGKPQNAIVGSDQATLKIQKPGVETLDGVAKLPGGTIVFRGRVTTGKGGSQIVPVVDGTGRFAGARGTVTISQIGADPRLALNVYRLTLPPAI